LPVKRLGLPKPVRGLQQLRQVVEVSGDTEDASARSSSRLSQALTAQGTLPQATNSFPQ
jgi:hypothetical protein